MLAIQRSSPKKCTPNLLPCRINHDGPINSASKFWTPETRDRGTQHVHFRGRHLHGISIPLPSNYAGAIVNVTEKNLPPTSTTSNSRNQATNDDEDAEDADMEDMDEEVKRADEVGTFDEIVIWEHGGKVDVEGSAFVRGLEEWIGFAEGMHCEGEEEVVEVDSKNS